MPITSTDLVFRLSGGSANTDATAALGGAMSTVAGGIITDNVANNVWDDVSGTESTDGDVEYRCLYVENTHGSLTLQNATFYFDSQPTQSALAAGADPAGVGGTATTVADESTAPAGVTFTAPTSGSPIALGNIGPGSSAAVWVRRTVSAGAAAANETPTYRVAGDTLA